MRVRVVVVVEAVVGHPLISVITAVQVVIRAVAVVVVGIKKVFTFLDLR